MEAERRAFSNHFGQDVDLKQIYRELGTAFGWTESERIEIAEQECEVEKALIRSIPCMKDEVDRARTNGYQIAFLSDMYLPLDFIRCQLSRLGCLKQGDICLISCESGKSKRDGRLFRSLIDEHNLPAKAITHTGDNPVADVAVPHQMGIRAKHFTHTGLNRFESILEAHSTATEGLSSLMAGASRMVRLHTPALSDREAALRDVAAGVMAPALVGYILWLLRSAQRKQFKRLYFVSRDGQVLKLIAEALIAKLGLEIECRYLYGSRQAWHLPGIQTLTEREFAWILARSDSTSLRRILSRVGLRPEDFANDLYLLGFKQTDYDRSLSDGERESLCSFLLNRPVQERILEESGHRGQLLAEYLRQEGLFEAIPSGIVEIGWNGRMQDSLDTILMAEGREPIHFFYFGLTKHAGISDYRQSYLFDGRRMTGYLPQVPQVWTITETFCAADHGMTTGYTQEIGSIQPLLRQKFNSKVIEWGLPIIRDALCRFLENLLLDSELVDWQADIRQPTAELFRAFWLLPTRDEALAWGDFPYEDDQSGETYFPLAEPYGAADIFSSFWLGAPNRNRASSWAQGSMRRTSLLVQLAMRITRRLGRIAKAPYRLSRALCRRGSERVRHAS
jgi:FMN phosphatase YigB (HAD superfamily)